jgi:hypothetical protein
VTGRLEQRDKEARSEATERCALKGGLPKKHILRRNYAEKEGWNSQCPDL